MLNRLPVVLALFAVAVYISGCASNFVVVDRTGMTFNLNKVKLTKGNKVEILDGEAIRHIPLKKIEKLIIDPSKTHYHDDKLYYHTEVQLLDGVIIKPRKAAGTVTKSFVSIHNVIIGHTESGQVKIPLEDVNVISQAKID